MRVYANDVEVPWQNTSHGLLVRLEGGIAADSTTRWAVLPSRAASTFTAQVAVNDTGTYYEMDNGITAVRIPKTIPCPTPATWEFPPSGPKGLREIVITPSFILAPVQGIRHVDGTWTGSTPNYLYTYASWGGDGVHTGRASWNWPATEPGLVEILESGPVRAKVRITYRGLRPSYWTNFGDRFPNPHEAWAQWNNEGYYICTITLVAGQNTIGFRNETNARHNWSLNMNTGASADRFRYKGHHSSSPANGHTYEGAVMTQEVSCSAEGEALLSAAGTRDGVDWAVQTWTGNYWDGVRFKPLYGWFTWGIDTGAYFYVYNSAGGSSSKVWGILQPRTQYAEVYYEVGIYGMPAAGTPTEVGFWAIGGVQLLAPNVGRATKSAFEIYVGTKAGVPVDFSQLTDPLVAGIPPNAGWLPTTPSEVSRAFQLHAGVCQAWKQIDQALTFPDPVGGYPGMHLTRTETEALIANLEADQGPGSHYAELYQKDSTYRDVWDAFANVDGLNTKAVTVLNYCLSYITTGIDVYVNKGSHYHPNWHYWQGGNRFQEMVIRTMALISLDQVRPFISAPQKLRLKALLSMAGHITWDLDFVPFDLPYAQITLGTANMPIQYGEQRAQFACVLRYHPQFEERFAGVLENSIHNFLNGSTVPSGAIRNSPHYAGSMLVPSTDVFRQLQVSDYYDVFAPGSEIHDRLVLTSEWQLQLASPPQYRFGGRRKMVAFGNGYNEGSNHMIALIMGFINHHPTLSKRLAWVWNAYDRLLSSFYSSTGLKIIPAVLTQDPALGDADFAGSMTIMRSSWGTADECAVFMLHGYANTDHSTFQGGTVTMYLLGAPVSTTFSGYNTANNCLGPWTGSNGYIAVSELDSSDEYPSYVWNTYPRESAVYPTELKCSSHYSYYKDTYIYEPSSTMPRVTCNFEVTDHWVRRLTYYRDDLAMPVVRLQDDNDRIGDTIYTLHIMATGSYKRSDGSTIAAPTTFTGTAFAITNGQHFEFTGKWGGVNVDVYYFGPTAEAMVGMFNNDYHPDREEQEYRDATGEPTFEELQYILRIKTAGPCDTVVVPYRTRPAGLNVTQTTGGLNLVTTATIGSPRFLEN